MVMYISKIMVSLLFIIFCISVLTSVIIFILSEELTTFSIFFSAVLLEINSLSLCLSKSVYFILSFWKVFFK